MSEKNKKDNNINKNIEKVKCPYCGHEQEFETIESINLSLNPEYKEKIMNEELFMFTCEECKEKAVIAFPCLVNDIEKSYLIWLLADYTEEQKQKLDEELSNIVNTENEKKFTDSYIKRIVSSINELKEKIMIIDEGLDDRVVEVLKLLCINEVAGQLNNLYVQEVRFNKDESGQWFLMLILRDMAEPKAIPINREMYDKTVELFKRDIRKNTQKNGYCEIDPFWAKAVIEGSKTGMVQ